MCRKIRHATLDSAGQHLVELVLTGKAKNPKRLHVYWCKRCKGYHVGHRSHGRDGK